MNEFVTNPFFRIFGAVLLVVGLGFMSVSLYKAWKHRGGRRIDQLMEAIASLYPIGLGFKFLMVGPEFFRFHLTDIGFPVSVGLLLFTKYSWSLAKNPYYQSLDLVDEQRLLQRVRRNFMVLGLLLSYGYETAIGLFYQTHPDKTPMLIGNFDWGDMLMYTLGALAGFSLLFWRHKLLERDVTAYQELLSAEQEAKRQLVKVTNQQLRKQYTPRRKKGNR
jgi:hypothetical protein